MATPVFNQAFVKVDTGAGSGVQHEAFVAEALEGTGQVVASPTQARVLGHAFVNIDTGRVVFQGVPGMAPALERAWDVDAVGGACAGCVTAQTFVDVFAVAILQLESGLTNAGVAALSVVAVSVVTASSNHVLLTLVYINALRSKSTLKNTIFLNFFALCYRRRLMYYTDFFL